MSTDRDGDDNHSTSRRWVGRAVGLILVSLAIVGLTRAEARSITEVQLIDGTAWVASPLSSDVVLGNSRTREVTARIPVAGTDLQIVQANADALLLDADAGTLSVLRGDQLNAEAVPLPDIAEQSFLVSDWGHHRLVDPVSGTVFEVDTTTASAIAVAELGPVDDAAVDASGTTWLTRESTGRVLSVDARRRSGSGALVADPETPLTLARGTTVELVIEGPTLTSRRLSGATMGPPREVCPSGTGPAATDVAFAFDDTLVLASATAVTISTDTCTTTERPQAASLQPHMAAATSNTVALVNDMTSSITLLDVASGSLSEIESGVTDRNRLEVFAKDDQFWFNELDGLALRVVDVRGDDSPTITAIEKVAFTDADADSDGSGTAIAAGDQGPTIDIGRDGQDRTENDERPALAARDEITIDSTLATTSPSTDTTAAAPAPATTERLSTVPTQSTSGNSTTSSTDATVTTTGAGAGSDVPPTSDLGSTTTGTEAPPRTTTSTTTPPPTLDQSAPSPANVLDADGSTSTSLPAVAARTPTTELAITTTTDPPTTDPPVQPNTPRAAADATATTPSSPPLTSPSGRAPMAVIQEKEGRARAFVGQTLTFTDVSTGSPTSRVWDFGDGITRSESEITHQWTEPGTHRVTLTVRNEVASDSDFVTIVVVRETPVFQPRFGWSPTSDAPVFEVGDTVSFDDQSTGAVDSWSWDWGDGSTSSGRSAVHVWDRPGLYDVVLQISGRALTSTGAVGDRLTRSTVSRVRIVSPAGVPTAVIDLQPNEIRAGDQVAVGARVTGDPTSWRWDFDDGTWSGARSVIKRYEVPGRYEVRLTVGNSNGTFTTDRAFTVQPVEDEPVARIDTSSLIAEVGESVDFTSVSAAEGDRSQWEWGDGRFSEGAEVSQTWDEPGAYRVTLRVTNGLGADQQGIDVVIDPVADPVEILVNGKPSDDAFNVTVGAGLRFETRGGRNLSGWWWDLGDSRVVSAASFTHDYDEPGTYEVEVTYRHRNVRQSRTVTVNVAPRPVTATTTTTTMTTAPTTTAAPPTTTTTTPPGAPTPPDGSNPTTSVPARPAADSAAPSDADSETTDPSTTSTTSVDATDPDDSPDTNDPSDSTGVRPVRPEIAFEPDLPVVGEQVVFRDTANTGALRTQWEFPHATVVSTNDNGRISTTFTASGVVTVTATTCETTRSGLCSTRTIDVLVTGR